MHITVETGDRPAWVTVPSLFGAPSNLFVEANSRARFPAERGATVRCVTEVENVDRGEAKTKASFAADLASVKVVHVNLVAADADAISKSIDNSQAAMPPSTAPAQQDSGFRYDPSDVEEVSVEILSPTLVNMTGSGAVTAERIALGLARYALPDTPLGAVFATGSTVRGRLLKSGLARRLCLGALGTYDLDHASMTGRLVQVPQ